MEKITKTKGLNFKDKNYEKQTNKNQFKEERKVKNNKKKKVQQEFRDPNLRITKNGTQCGYKN